MIDPLEIGESYFYAVLVPLGRRLERLGRFTNEVSGFESVRVIPPLALVTLFGLIFGIGDSTAVPLLIFASIWIMLIAARAGVRNAPLPKVFARSQQAAIVDYRAHPECAS